MQTRLSGAERKTQIIIVAAKLFAQNGFSSTRTKEIANAAGINEAIIYQHFKSKEELYDAAIDMFIAQIRDIVISTAHEVDIDLKTMLTVLANNVISFTEANVSFTRMLFFSALQDNKFSDKFFDSISVPVLKAMSSKIEAGKKTGEFRSDLQAPKAAFTFLGSILMFNVARNIIKAEEIRNFDQQEYIQTAINIFLDGIMCHGSEEKK